MAVLISNGNTDLHATNGFYRVEASNLGFYHSTILLLSTTRTIAVTFANAGNCKGLVLVLMGNITGTRDVTVKLKESGTERASKTLTATSIANGTNPGEAWCVPFEFATPYAVDTTASKWTFEISQGTGTNDWALITSNGTAPGYATWCDNAMTFANDDVIICKDQVTVTQDATIGSVFGTGVTNEQVSILICKSNTPPSKTNNVANLLVQNTTTATLTVKGMIVYSAHSAMQVGTSTTPISASNPFKLLFGTPASGYVGFIGAGRYGYSPRATFLFYGESPAIRSYSYTADAPVGQSYFGVADTTGISAGDTFWLSGTDDTYAYDARYYTVTSTTSTNVYVTPNITGYKRLSGFKAYKANGYGIDISWSGVRVQSYNFSQTSNFYMEGVRFWVSDTANNSNQTLTFRGGSISQSGEDAGYHSKLEIYKCVRGFGGGVMVSGNIPMGGFRISESYGFNSQMMIDNMASIGGWTVVGELEEINNYSSNISQRTQTTFGYPTWRIEGNIYENPFLGYLKGNNSVFKNNYIKGGSSGGWQIYLVDFLNCAEWSGNTWDSTPTSIRFDAMVYNLDMRNEHRLARVTGFTNYVHLIANTGSLQLNVTVTDPDFNCIVSSYASTEANRKQIIDGSRIGVVRNNNTDNVFSFMPYGTITRTGASMTDTTVRTTGGSAMRFEPVDSNGLLLMHWGQSIPTGNIQSKTMTVSLWVKLNNSAYYGGTHTKPTLTINYDNGTTVSSVALGNTNWQLLACTFTPTTTYGQIEMKVTGATDATGTNRYFYVDDVNVAYPAGVAIDLGNLDLWAEGLPVAPAIATMPSLGGVWDEPMSAHTIPGSAGKVLADAKKKANIAANR